MKLRKLAPSLRHSAEANPGCILDEHKRQDAIYLKDQFKLLKQHDIRKVQGLLEQVLKLTSQANIFINPGFTRRSSKTQNKNLKHTKTSSHIEMRKAFLRKPTPPDLKLPIPGVITNGGGISTDANDISSAHYKYWGQLFQSPSREFQTTDRLQRRFMDAPLTANNFYWAITKTAKDKASGPDGLPVEYYQVDASLWAQVFENDNFLLIAFADDCTGTLKHLADAPAFLQLVQTYSSSAGLTLNLNKTSIMPFSPLPADHPLLEEIQQLNVAVIPADGFVKPLGILQGPNITAEDRSLPLLTNTLKGCHFWKYRARTLQGRVVFLRSIVLPLLWYTTAAAITRIMRLIKTFIAQQPISTDEAARSQLAEHWSYKKPSQGGLGAPNIDCFVQALHLTTVRNGIHHIRKYNQVPRWLKAAMSSFTSAMGGLGNNFDILFAPIPAQLIKKFGTTSWKRSILDIPIWFNRLLSANATGQTIAEAAKHSKHFARHRILRLRDFVTRFGRFPTREDIRRLLPTDLSNDPRAVTRRDFVTMENQHLYGLLYKLLPQDMQVNLPLAQHAPNEDELWRLKLRLTSDLLPVFTDIRYCLRHNALGTRHKYQWNPSNDVTCPLCSDDLETPKHLFWICEIAPTLWSYFLEPLHDVYQRVSIICNSPSQVELQQPSERSQFFESSTSSARLFFDKCGYTGTRNHKIYNNITVNALQVRHEVTAYLRLHLQLLYNKQVEQTPRAAPFTRQVQEHFQLV
ncbi:TPA: hypothetical protein N0F65_005237 [Lagenidium giganteum]|uniref:Reverse transcriptase domain-containing protein n=1 Tax=Lagenidium giganteum TaxID=4803 RepID=A0AAV2YNJ2_9STRA|nr:TPA: hypothetical protein N0F65_005237 [Lagenidium giganteum]